MFTHSFQLILIFSCAIVIVMIAAYGVYCRSRANSFVGTGRVTDIHTWALKANISWIASFVLAIAMIIPFIVS
jgi:hypothetical protein